MYDKIRLAIDSCDERLLNTLAYLSDKRRLVTSPFDNRVLNTLAYFSTKHENFYHSSFIARRLRKLGMNVTDDEVENSLSSWAYYKVVQKSEEGCYRVYREGRVDLSRN